MPFGGASQGGASGCESGAPRSLTRVIDQAPWLRVQGIAADNHGRVYVSAESTTPLEQAVYLVTGGRVDTYLTSAEAADAAGLAGFNVRLYDIDIGPDGAPYLIVDRTRIIRIPTPHHADLWPTASFTRGQYLGVWALDSAAIVKSNGSFITVTATVSNDLYLLNQWGTGCFHEDLAILPSGTFLYMPGCLTSPLIRGSALGVGFEVLFNVEPFVSSPLNAHAFRCIARDPVGGFYAMVEGATDGGPHLYHVAEDATALGGTEEVETSPSLVAAANDENGNFDYCSIAVDNDGTVFIEDFAELWKVTCQ